jgi:hypothetical protein
MARRQRVSDSTQLMPAVTEPTQMLPAAGRLDPNRTVERAIASAPLPPSQQPQPAPTDVWRPQVAGDGPWAGIPISEVRHDRRSRQILLELAAEAPDPVYAEDSFQSLAAYDAPGRTVRTAAVNASWFRTGVCDQTRFDQLMERFVVERGVLAAPVPRDRPAGSLDTQQYTVLNHPQFANDTTGKAAA